MKKQKNNAKSSSNISKKGLHEYQKLLSAAQKATQGKNPYRAFIDNNKAAWKELASK